MNEENKPSPPESTTESRPRKKRILLKLLLGLAVLVLILIGSTPALLSSGAARKAILDRVNASMKGTLSAENWRLGWFSAQTIQGLRFTDEKGHSVAHIERLSLSKGLLAMARSKDLGLVQLDNPVIDLPAPAAEPAAGPEAPGVPAPPVKPDEPSPITIPVVGTFKIVNARVALASEPLLEHINAEFKIGPGQPLRFDLTAKASKGSGLITAKGQVELPESTDIDVNTLPVEADIRVDSLDLAPILSWAASSPQVPSGSGLVNASFKAQGNPIRFEGRIAGNKLAFKGGPLGKDEPTFESVELDFKGGLTGGELQLENLELRSPVLQAKASGNLKRITLNAEAILPELFARFPTTMKLREGMTIQDGRLKLDGTVGLPEGGQDIAATLTLAGLSGTLDNKTVALEKPVTVTVDTALREGTVDIRELLIEASFISGHAKGNLDQMKIHLETDLPAALGEVEKFIEIGAWKAGGVATLDATIAPDTEGERRITAALDIKGLALSEADLPLITDENVNIRLNATGDLEKGTLSKASLVYNAAFGKGGLQLGDVRYKGENRPLSVILGSLAFNGSVNLAQLGPVLHRFGGTPVESRVDGNTTINLAGSLKGNTLTLGTLEVQGENLAYDTPDSLISEKSLSLSTALELNSDTRSLTLRKLALGLSAGKLSAPALSVRDWQTPLPTLDGSLEAIFDIPSLQRIVQQKKANPDQAPAQIQGLLNAKLTFKPGDAIDADLKIRNFKQQLADGRSIEEAEIALQARVVPDQDGLRLDLPKLKLSTSPLVIEGKLALTGMKSEKQLLEISGSQTANMARMAEYLKFFTGQDIAMSGQETRPLSVRMTLGGKTTSEIMGEALIQAALHVERMEVYGLEISQLDVPLNVTNGLTFVSVDAQVNQGKVALRPQINWKDERPAITFAENSRILENVQLTDKLADALLGKIHPLFKGASVAAGTINMNLEQFYWPIEGGEQDGRISGVIELRGVQLAASGLLGQILSVAKIKESAADIGDKDIYFTLANGRIETNPIKLKVDGHPISIGGSIGLKDLSLLYAASVPLSEGLVGRSAMKYVPEGTEVRLPIGGTTSSPRISSDGLKSEVARLTKQAGAQALIGLLGGDKKKDPPPAPAPNGNQPPPAGGQVTDQPPPKKPKTSQEQLEEELKKKAGKLLDGLFK